MIDGLSVVCDNLTVGDTGARSQSDLRPAKRDRLRRAPDIRRENNGRFGSGRFGTDVSVRPGAMIACLDTTTYHPSVIFCDRSSADTDRVKARPRL